MAWKASLVSVALFASLLGCQSATVSENGNSARSLASVYGEEIRSKFVNVGDEQYHYLSAGDETKPVILFVHGFPEFSLTWLEQLKFFGERYHAIAVDMRGYGKSSKPSELGQYNAKSVADGLSQFIKTVSPGQKIILVGHDWGGVISWLTAALHPETLRALVILNVGHPVLFAREYAKGPKAYGPDVPAQYDLSAYIRNIRDGVWNEAYWSQDSFKPFRVSLFDNPIGQAAAYFTDEVRQEYVKAWTTVDPKTGVSGLTGSLNYYRAQPMSEPGRAAPGGAPAPLLKIAVPTLVLWGNKEIYASEKVNEGLDKLVPDLTLKRFDGLSHWILHEDPGLVNSEIQAYLKTRVSAN